MAEQNDTGGGANVDERGVALTVAGRREARRKLDDAARRADDAGDEAGQRLPDKLRAA